MAENLGVILGTDGCQCVQTDEAFFDLLRDKAVINAMLRDIGGRAVAEASIASTANVQKKVIMDCLGGTRKGGKDIWLPRCASFPTCACTKRGGIRAIRHSQTIKAHHAE